MAEALADKGWRTVPQVGVSGYRIDLGVVHPDEGGRFLAAVECDGATYHRSATARDRDLLREQVLRGLGWEVLRVWSLDWWHSAASATERLHQKLTELLALDRQQKIETENEEVADVSGDSGEVVDEDTDHAAETSPATVADDPEAEQEKFVFQRIARGATPASQNGDDELPSEIYEPEIAMDPDKFTEPGYRSVLRSFIMEIVNRDGPLRADVLARIVAKAHGFGRAGARIRDVVKRAIPRNLPKTREGQQVFLWPEGTDPQEWRSFRTLPTGETISVEEMPLQELRVLVNSVEGAGMSKEELIVELAHRLGLRRVGRNVRERIEAALRSVQT